MGRSESQGCSVSEDIFDRTWRACAQRGWCDNLGGCEYQRVRGEWAASPTPIGNLHEFIRRRANIGPDGAEPCYGSGVKKESAWTTDLDEVFEETIKSETSATPVLWSSAVVGAVLQTTVEWGSAGGRAAGDPRGCHSPRTDGRPIPQRRGTHDRAEAPGRTQPARPNQLTAQLCACPRYPAPCSQTGSPVHTTIPSLVTRADARTRPPPIPGGQTHSPALGHAGFERRCAVRAQRG